MVSNCSSLRCDVLKAVICVFLSTEHLLVAVPVAVVSAVGGFLVSQYLNRRCCQRVLVNTSISKDSPKVVHSFDMEDIGSKAVYCRCWKSKKVRPPPHCFSSAECLENYNYTFIGGGNSFITHRHTVALVTQTFGPSC